MPTYDYECSACGHKFDKFQSITADPIKKCPECGKNAVKRLIGIGAGVIFKGGGFYETDYRSESYKSDAKKDSGDGGGKSESKSESKSDAKTETKSDKNDSRPATAESKPAAKADAPAKSEGKTAASK